MAAKGWLASKPWGETWQALSAYYGARGACVDECAFRAPVVVCYGITTIPTHEHAEVHSRIMVVRPVDKIHEL